MQWKLLHLFQPRKEDKELIKDFDSLLKVVRLLFVTSSWGLRIFCLLWVRSPIPEIYSLYLVL